MNSLTLDFPWCILEYGWEQRPQHNHISWHKDHTRSHKAWYSDFKILLASCVSGLHTHSNYGLTFIQSLSSILRLHRWIRQVYFLRSWSASSRETSMIFFFYYSWLAFHLLRIQPNWKPLLLITLLWAQKWAR